MLDVLGKRAQAAEDALVVGVVRAELKAVALGHGERKLERVDRIKAKIAAEESRIRIDRLRFHPVDIQVLHDELGKLALGGRLCGGGWRIHRLATLKSGVGAEKRPRSVSSARPRIPRTASFEPVSQLIAPSVISETPSSLPPLRIGYTRADASSLLAEPDTLAVIGFGAAAAGDPTDPRWLRVGLEPAGDAMHEVWRGRGKVQYGRAGEVRWSSDGDYSFVAIEVDEAAHDGIAAATDHAYRALIAFVHASATPHLLRVWNYLDAINLGDGDDERYRHFCVGRARAMTELWRGDYPAATAIGRRDGVRVLQVYAMATRERGAPVENPRQVSAWRYPREYGPTAPTFARGMTTPAAQLLISGTAAVVGFASQHRDDVAAQLDETLANLASLLGSARSGATLGAGGVLKAYVRDASKAAVVAATLRERAPSLDGLLVLAGDICRRELLIEIDGVQS